MKKTLALVLIALMAMTMVFAANTSTKTLTLLQKVAETGEVDPGSGEEADLSSLLQIYKNETLTDENLVAEAEEFNVDIVGSTADTTDDSKTFYFGYHGNRISGPNYTITMTTPGFYNTTYGTYDGAVAANTASQFNTLDVAVTFAGTEDKAESVARWTSTAADDAKSLGVIITNNKNIVNPTEVGKVALTWDQNPDLAAGNYQADVSVSITANN